MRIYGAGEPAATILQVIREDELDMKVMLGAWIAADAFVGPGVSIGEGAVALDPLLWRGSLPLNRRRLLP